MSQFGFLTPEWPDIHDAATRAETQTLADPRAATFYARYALERVLDWLYRADKRLKSPYQDNLAARIHEPTFRTTVGETIFRKADYLKTIGNKAAHGDKPVSEADARTALRELFHLTFWLARTYARGQKPADTLAFDPAKLPRPMAQVAKFTLEQLRRREAELHERDAAYAKLQADHAEADAELKALREQVAAALAINLATLDTHDYKEAETRNALIDLLLRESGWDPAGQDVAEYPVTGMPTPAGAGRVDYVLWGADGKPLALVEAKRTRTDPSAGQHQAKLYADCLQAMHGQRPVIFYSNGYEHWLWDDTNYPPRQVAGFYKPSELTLLIQRRTTRRSLADAEPDKHVVERYYQQRAIRRIAEHFERDRQRRALVVMATGAGKTRTVIALVDLLMRQNWAKRVLFLADRTALVTQAVNAFKHHLPAAAPVNLVTDKSTEGRVYVSTYPTMMRLIEEQQSGARRFGPGHFDLIIVDEAHRSIYRKYAAIFDWFDSLLVGLTATPKDEIDRNTYGLFELETSVPTDAYPLESAVKDGYLVPMRALSVPLKFQRQGIRYDDLSDEEKETWDALEWDEEDGTPDHVDPQALNKWLFNEDTVDKALAHLMTHGQHVEAGDRLGKTIIFAKNQAHAAYIQRRFDANYPAEKGVFARVIHSQVVQAQNLIDKFSQANHPPHIAISVDMLDTGIDVPEVLNLVFFKFVRSKTKFAQMIGRGTRLCPNLFGPGQDKQNFTVFDFCQNLEYFSQDVPTIEAAVAESLSAKLFKARAAIVTTIDARPQNTEPDLTLRVTLADHLRTDVQSMNPENFIVRPHRRLVETYAVPEAWQHLSDEACHQLVPLADLPTERSPEGLEAKQFDLLILTLQLGVLGKPVPFPKLKTRVMETAAALEEQSNIPVIAAQMPLIEEIQTPDWWQDITAALLDEARRKLRGLVHLIERRKRETLYTRFQDEIGEATEIAFARFTPPDSFERFRAKTRHYLRQHDAHVVIHKLRGNHQLTQTDLDELERMLRDSGADPEEIDRAKSDAPGLGLFVRSLVGLDRAAAKAAFASFLTGRTLTANQIDFVDLIVEHLTENGMMPPERLYESPYTDLSPLGVDGVFTQDACGELASILNDVRRRAAA